MLRSPVRPGRGQAAEKRLSDRPGGRAFRSLAGNRRRADILAIVILIALPIAVFGLPALFGHPVWPGDDLTQNYPLRVLVGRQLASGQLPLFDPYIWSGAPLLAEWNAAAAYPLTWLFALLPGVAAWTVNMAVTWIVAALGMFWFLRALRLRSLASFLGALSFAFAGAMPAQVGHFGLVAGMSWVPLELLAVLRLTQDRSVASRLRWVCVLAGAFGLTILAGEPRAIDDAGLILLIFAVWRVARAGRGAGAEGLSGSRLRGYGVATSSVLAGLALGACLGAVQLLPGLAAVGTSQRAARSLALFNSGSLTPKWLVLMLVPDLLGGSGSFGQPSYFAHYNLAEVTSYVGVLPLVAAFALVGRLRFRERAPEWIVWHVVALVGVLFALGGHTAFGHLLVHVPLIGDQRLQSRSIAVVDLALAVLLGYWADEPFGDRSRLGARRGVRRIDAGMALGILPPLAVVVFAVVGVSSNRAMMDWLGLNKASAAVGRQIWPWLFPYAVIGGAAIALVMLGRRLGPRLRAGLVAGFVLADVVVFTLLAVVAVSPGRGTSRNATAQHTTATTIAAASGRDRHTAAGHSAALRPVSALGYRGRFAVYDPGLIDAGQLALLGSPDLNVISATPSVQGYSSIVDGHYAEATGAHLATGNGQDVLAPRAITDGVLGQLNATTLATVSAYLLTSKNGHGAARPGPPGTGQRDIAADHRGTWYFAAPLNVSRLQVPDSDARQDAAGGVQIGLVTPSGTVRWFPATAEASATLQIRPSRPVTSVAAVGRAGSRASPLGPPSIFVPGRGVLVADGQLQNALQPPQWVFGGQDGQFGVFVNRDARGALQLQALAGQSTAGASVTADGGPAVEPAAATVSSPRGVRLVRSVAAIPGWTATWQPRGGPPVPLAVQPDGIVQAVDIPAGKGVVTWSYVPPWFGTGLGLSIFGLAAVAALLVVSWWRRKADACLPAPGTATEPAQRLPRELAHTAPRRTHAAADGRRCGRSLPLGLSAPATVGC